VKFLVDECTGIWVSKQLRQMGFESVSVIEVMKGAGYRDDCVVALGFSKAKF